MPYFPLFIVCLIFRCLYYALFSAVYSMPYYPLFLVCLIFRCLYYALFSAVGRFVTFKSTLIKQNLSSLYVLWQYVLRQGWWHVQYRCFSSLCYGSLTPLHFTFYVRTSCPYLLFLFLFLGIFYFMVGSTFFLLNVFCCAPFYFPYYWSGILR